VGLNLSSVCCDDSLSDVLADLGDLILFLVLLLDLLVLNMFSLLSLLSVLFVVMNAGAYLAMFTGSGIGIGPGE
jgi:hypothetical protein